MKAKSIVDVDLASLVIAEDRIERMGFARLPTWEEVFIAIRSIVEEADGMIIEVGNVAIAIMPDQGKCLLYSGLTSAVLNVLIRNPLGIAAGGIAIRSTEDADGYYCLPKDDVKRPNLGGGYHAWNLIEHGGEHYLIDMSYHWFARKLADCSGPSEFIVARQETLSAANVFYHQHDAFTQMIATSLTPEALEGPTRGVIWKLREIVNGEETEVVAESPRQAPSGILAAVGRIFGRRS